MIGESLEGQSSYFPAKSYLLNAADRFVWFSPEWNLEFQAVLGPAYNSDDYLGVSFFEILADPEIKAIYRALYRIARQTHREPLRLTLRCDNYPLKILMSQELSGHDDGSIRIEFHYIKLETMAMPLQAYSWEQNEPLKMCSWCQSIFDAEKATWLPLDKALVFFPLLHDVQLPAITHGCCPACFQTLRGQLHEYSGGGR